MQPSKMQSHVHRTSCVRKFQIVSSGTSVTCNPQFATDDLWVSPCPSLHILHRFHDYIKWWLILRPGLNIVRPVFLRCCGNIADALVRVCVVAVYIIVILAAIRVGLPGHMCIGETDIFACTVMIAGVIYIIPIMVERW